jgi:hypothetical protein
MRQTRLIRVLTPATSLLHPNRDVSDEIVYEENSAVAPNEPALVPQIQTFGVGPPGYLLALPSNINPSCGIMRTRNVSLIVGRVDSQHAGSSTDVIPHSPRLTQPIYLEFNFESPQNFFDQEFVCKSVHYDTENILSCENYQHARGCAAQVSPNGFTVLLPSPNYIYHKLFDTSLPRQTEEDIRNFYSARCNEIFAFHARLWLQKVDAPLDPMVEIDGRFFLKFVGEGFKPDDIEKSFPDSTVLFRYLYRLLESALRLGYPLHVFASSRFHRVVRALVQSHRYDLIQMHTGTTPLHLAAAVGAVEVITELLQHPQADEALTIRDATGLTALEVAGLFRRPLVHRILREGTPTTASSGTTFPKLATASGSFFPADVLSHHLSKYNVNKHARQVCRAWRDHLPIPPNLWVSIAAKNAVECRDRLRLALTHRKVKLRGPPSSNDSDFARDVLSPCLDELKSNNRAVLFNWTHIYTAWSLLREIELFAPHVQSLFLVEPVDPQPHSLDICKRISACFPSARSLKVLLPGRNRSGKWDYDAIVEGLPQLQSLRVPHSSPKQLLENMNGNLKKVGLELRGGLAKVVIRVPTLHVYHVQDTDITTAEHVTSLRLREPEEDRHNSLGFTSLSMFRNLHSLRVDFYKDTNKFEMILQANWVQTLHMTFKSHHDALLFIRKCCDKTPEQQSAVATLKIDARPDYRNVIKTLSLFPPMSRKFETTLHRLTSAPAFPELRQIYLCDAFSLPRDEGLKNQFSKKGVSLLYF